MKEPSGVVARGFLIFRGGKRQTGMSAPLLVAGLDDDLLPSGDRELAALSEGDFVEDALEFEDVGNGGAADGGDDVALAEVGRDEGAGCADPDNHQAAGGAGEVGGAGGGLPVGGDGAEEHALPAEAAA